MSIELSLLSPEFWALSLTAIVLLISLRGVPRHLVFLAANVVFLWGMLLGPRATLATIGFCLLGYGLTHLVVRWPRWGFRASLLAYVALFIYMRNYDFLGWVLPDNAARYLLSSVGLSFLFFKIVHVMIEARSGTLGTLKLFPYLNYSLAFTTFMMGPIQRYQDFYAQWYGEKLAIPLTFEAHLDSTLRVLVGLVKAYIAGVMILPFATAPSDFMMGLPILKLLVYTYAFYVYLYLNFSGYCDVVIGVGSLLGVRPPENFDKPFLAQNVSEFWLRMHRSLTLWLTDYVFSPLYKWSLRARWLSNHPLLALHISLIVTMVICGLWHGTTLSFLLFGILHGLYLVVYRTWDTVAARLLGKRRLRELRTRRPVQLAGIFLTFNAVSIAFLFFRLNASDALRVAGRLVGI